MVPYIYFRIPSYGLLAIIGLAVSISYLYYQWVVDDKLKLESKNFLKLIISCGIGCVIGSKILFSLTQLPSSIANCSVSEYINALFFGGFVFYGGLLGALCGAIIFAKRHGFSSKTTVNTVIPAFVLFHGFGRIGCFLSGCCYGFALSEKVNFLAAAIHHFPVQLVEAVFEFVMFWLLYKVVKFEKRIKVYLVAYAVFRFIAEYFRGDEVRGFLLGLSTSQWISILILLIMAVGFAKKHCIKNELSV